ncbi:MAG: hypothetical protein R3277_09960 [Brumimicrobium sp.]|nr:hypothetical protein [Brumimicrobium sp.]
MKFGLIIIIVAFSVLSCRKEPTSWQTDWISPVLNDSLSVADFVNDSTLEINPDNSVQVIFDRDIVSLNLSEIIQIPDTTIIQDFGISVSSLNLPPGTNFVDEIKEHDFDLEDAALLEARVKRGTAYITVSNPIQTKGIFKVQLPGVTKNGVTFSQTETVPAASGGIDGVKNFELDLSDYSINLRGENGDSYNKLQSKLTVTTDPNGPAVTITNQDTIKFKVEFKDMVVDYAKGYFGSSVLSDTTDLKLDFLSNIIDGAANLDDVYLDVTVSNGLKVVGQGKITLVESKNYANSVVILSHPEINQELNINPAQGNWSSIIPSERVITFEPGNSNILPFLENLGANYRLGYEIHINPWGNTSNGNDEIFPDSKLKLNLKTDFPLNVGLDNLTLKDTFEVDFNNDNRFMKVQSGSFVLKTKNYFPFGGNAELVLMDENYSVLGTVTSDQSIQPAPMETSGSAHLKVENELVFDVSEELAKDLPEIKYIVVQVKMNSTDFNNNQVYANARLKFILQTKFKLRAEL